MVWRDNALSVIVIDITAVANIAAVAPFAASLSMPEFTRGRGRKLLDV
jgi:hypothetical protein